MDDLLWEAYRDRGTMAEGLEAAVASKMTSQRKRWHGAFRFFTGKRGRKMRMRPVFAALCAVFFLGSAVTAYGAAKGLSVGQLFARIWGEREQEISLEQFSTEVDVLSEKSTFKDIDIEPVQAVSDGHVTYVVLKVEGINGFRLTDEMAFDVFNLDDVEQSADSLDSYVLKREGNAMYVALRSRMEKAGGHRQTLSVDVYNLYHAKLDEMGRCIRVKHMVTEQGEEDGTSYGRYTEESFAAKGEYHGKISCDVQGDQLEISTEKSGTFQVRALSVVTDQDISEEVGLVDAGGQENTVYILMRDGSEVQAMPCAGREGGRTYDGHMIEGFTAFELREPVDLKEVKGIRVLGHVYDVGKKFEK